MKAAIVDPYLDTLGGGERYTLSFAKILIDLGWKVVVQWKDQNIRKKLEDRFGMDLAEVEFTSDVKRGDGCDLCFWVSDGSIPTLRARKNILHFQVPFQKVGGNSLLNKMKLFRIDRIICNSNFTKKVIDKEYGVESVVIYPPVDISSIKSKRKENIILFVGRFSSLMQTKRQDVLIKSFRRLYDSGVASDYELVLAGGVEVGVGSYLNRLRKIGEGYPIKFIQSPKFKELKELYEKAKFFWSASGFKIDEVKDPNKVEHFGMSVVEAMSGGVTPLIYNAGGHMEIVEDGKNGYLWNSPTQLIRKTKVLINDNKLSKNLSTEAMKRSRLFSLDRFREEIIRLVI